MIYILIFGAIILLILVNGFFVASEFGLVKIRQSQIEQLKFKHKLIRKKLQYIFNNLDAFLSTCQLGITITSLILGWICEPLIQFILRPILDTFIINTNLLTIISFGIAFTGISFIHLVIGELVPKSIAIRTTEKIIILTTIPLYYFYFMFYPIIYILNSISLIIIKKLGLNVSNDQSHPYSFEEIKLILSSSHSHDNINNKATKLIENTLAFNDLIAADIMRPIDELIYIEIHSSKQEILKIIKTKKYSRYPIFNTETKKFLGIIHIKDLIAQIDDTVINDINLKQIIRPILSSSLNKPIANLLDDFNNNFCSFTLVASKNLDLIGFVSMEDIIATILGSARDEFNENKSIGIKLKDNSIIMRGTSSIYSLQKLLNISIDEPSSHTIIGLITNKLERIPKPLEVINFDKFIIKIQRMKGPNVLLVKITLI